MFKSIATVFVFAALLAGNGQAFAKGGCPAHSHLGSNGAGALTCVCDTGYSRTVANPNCVWNGGIK